MLIKTTPLAAAESAKVLIRQLSVWAKTYLTTNGILAETRRFLLAAVTVTLNCPSVLPPSISVREKKTAWAHIYDYADSVATRLGSESFAARKEAPRTKSPPYASTVGSVPRRFRSKVKQKALNTPENQVRSHVQREETMGGPRGGSTAASISRKRDRETTSDSNAKNLGDDRNNHHDDSHGHGPGPGGTSSNFRNVSACNRCRHRKNRCDQKLPRCSACVKAGITACVGFDPVSKREIPRSYVYFLETRVRGLEELVVSLGGTVPPVEGHFAVDETIQPGINVPFPVLEGEGSGRKKSGAVAKGDEKDAERVDEHAAIDPNLNDAAGENEKIDKLVNNLGMVSVQGTSDSRAPGSTSGVSFARVVYAAVKSSVQQNGSDRGGTKSTKAVTTDAATGGGSTMRDSFFGLHTRPTIKPAPFPDMQLGRRLVELYFEHTNPQIPILHRGEFMALFDRVYAKPSDERTSRELYLMNIVFAIGSGIIMDSAGTSNSPYTSNGSDEKMEESPRNKRTKLSRNQQCQPEEYHSSAIVHLESFLSTSAASEGHGGGLEELQAVLLLAGLALLRPVAPGLWYIIGVALRLSVDLGLHYEDSDPELDALDIKAEPDTAVFPSRSLGRKQWTRDLRRRLWWSVYSLDRLVSTCVGRPCGITDQVITTEFPSVLDDRHITTSGFLKSSLEYCPPTSKLVTHHYFRLRLLQSEILQVLQYRQAQQARSQGANQTNQFMHTHLPSPFLQHFNSFRDWRADVDRRLREWKTEAPTQAETGVGFNPLFFDLNYWQGVIMLYRQSLAVPAPLAEEFSASTGESVDSPGTLHKEFEEDEQLVCLKVAQAAQTVLKLYRQLHRLRLVNYTFLATHHLFMSGISFLYALWHSPVVRSHLTLDDVDFTILAATSVLTDLIPNCPPAEACRDAFTRMAKATITMCMSTTGFGVASSLGSQTLDSPVSYVSPGQLSNDSMSVHPMDSSLELQQHQSPGSERRQVPKFDMNLRDLFSDVELQGRTQTFLPQQQYARPGAPQQQPRQQQQDAAPFTGQTYAIPATPDTSAGNEPSPMQYQPDFNSMRRQSQPAYSTYQQQQQQQQQNSLSQTISQQPPTDFSFDTLDFLDTFPDASDVNVNGNNLGTSSAGNAFWPSGEVDLGFGTGGLAGWSSEDTGGAGGVGNMEGVGSGGGGVDLFDGFFFGGGGGFGG
ncbi:hypothetical protein Q7P37_005599 [Cladosporium fusiforme]